MAEAIALAKELNDMLALTVALWAATILAQLKGDPAEVERLASDRAWNSGLAGRQVPYYLGLKAEALHLAGRTSEALDATIEAEAVIERREQR